jgi:uncharacterized protein DUF4398
MQTIRTLRLRRDAPKDLLIRRKAPTSCVKPFPLEEIQMRKCIFSNAIIPRSMPALALMGALITAAGCASAPKPTADLAQAHALVDQAEQSGAPQFASADLATARSKLQQADLDAAKHPEQSISLAQEASIDAQIAIVRTNSAKAQQALRDVNAGTQTLRNETDRMQIDRAQPSIPTASPSTQVTPQ